MGEQRTERECIYIHLHRRLLERSEFRAVGTRRYQSPPSLGSAAFGFVGPACFGGGLWARLLRVLGSLPLILGSEGVKIWVLDRF